MKGLAAPALFLVLLSFCHAVLAAAVSERRTTPPPGSLVVRAGTTTASEFASVAAAVAALPSDNSTQTIFIYPGTYTEQVYITRAGPLTIYGYTSDTLKYSANRVTIQANTTAAAAGSNDASATVRIHTNDFKMYNVNVKNLYDIGTQAVAFAQYGSRVGLYACAFYGYQDTLYANAGTQVYLRNYIEGATDFIFGRGGLAFFGKNTIGVVGPGWTSSTATPSSSHTMHFPLLPELASLDVPGAVRAFVSAHLPFMLIPYHTDFAKVIFKNTHVTAPFNNTLWSIWNPGDERTDNILFGEYGSSGPGVRNAVRPAFVTVLSRAQAAEYSISSAVGSDWKSWVDDCYI
ncbi:hypothetical protein DXG01_009426 [Tephrocybe rancida]|nr:hypothetical protein DXG01_009426 [Tephrocybe rancida]